MIYALVCLLSCAALEASATTTDAEAKASLKKLYKATPAAKLLGDKAVAILVFPSIVKGGLMVGGAIGNGSLLKKGKVVGHYNSVAASYGLQAGVQTYGYALFFMNAKALQSLDDTDGFEVGVGPSIVVVDEGMGKSMTSSTATQDIYAFIFGQQGLMAGLGIQGSKITKTK
jgi:lipid-binding SYLF domain-containing protein